MPIVIDNINQYILEIHNNSLTITLKTYNVASEKKKIALDKTKKTEFAEKLLNDA
tara:strand:- start:71 stop:235 length:165 start_codon:yes stop_codon:yes gene_type:complete